MKLLKGLGLCFVLLSCQQPAPKPELILKKAQAPYRTAKVTKPISAQKKDSEVTLSFVGDVILHERLRKREEATNEGYQTIWSNIQSYLDKADYTYANLEGPVAPEYGGVTGFPMFNFPEEIIPTLKDNGFDVVSTGNNHALDRQSKGIIKTIENLDKYGLQHTGTVTDPLAIEQQLETWWTLTKAPHSEKNIAWLSCTEMTNGNPDKEHQVLYCFKDREKIKEMITTLKAQSDIGAIILLPHWGEEDKFDIEPHVKAWGRKMLDLGASAIVGSHPHVVRKIEEYKTKDRRRTIVAYSLGNFVSNQRLIPNRLGMLFYLKFKDRVNQKSLELTDYRFIPLWTKRTIEKDGTAKYRINAVWDLSKLPEEASQICQTELGDKKRLTSENDVLSFLTKK